MLTESQSQLVKDNIKLAQYIANKWRKKLTNIEFDEVLSSAYLGLSKSAQYFDSTKGYAFATFAVRCMDNEVLRYLRKQKKHYDVWSFETIIAQNLSKPDEKLTLEDILGEDDKSFDIAFLNYTFEHINALPDREKRIFIDKYVYGYGQTEIGKRMGISQPYVSRIASRAEKRLKQKIGE